MALTNRGIARLLEAALRGTWNGGSLPTTFKASLCTSATAPTVDTNTLSELTECPTANGYTQGGINIERSSVGWDVLTEDDTNDRGELQAKDIAWTASGGTMPSTAARYLVITDDNATLGSRDIIAYFDLGSDQQVSDGQPLTYQNATIRGQQPA